MITKSELISVSVRNQTCTGWPGGFTEEEICDWGSDKGVALAEYFRHRESPNRSEHRYEKDATKSYKVLRRRFDLPMD